MMRRHGTSILFASITAAFSLLRVFQPGPERPLVSGQIAPAGGFAYSVAGSAAVWPLKRMILENCLHLSEADGGLDEVRKIGGGRYFFSERDGLFFSPTVEIDPRKNDYSYRVRTFIFILIHDDLLPSPGGREPRWERLKTTRRNRNLKNENSPERPFQPDRADV